MLIIRLRASMQRLASWLIALSLFCCAKQALCQEFNQGSGPSSAQCRVRVVSNDVFVSNQERVETGYYVQPPGIILNPSGWPYFAWSDSPLGVVRTRDGAGYLFFGSDGGCHENCDGAAPRSGSITVSEGTLDHPLGGNIGPGSNPLPSEFLLPTSANLPPTMDYVGGGPVYRVPGGEPGADNLLVVYHVERPLPSGNFWTWLGLAKSTDEGATWQDLGIFLSFTLPFNPRAVLLDMGLENLVVATDRTTLQKYFYIYFPEFYWLNNIHIDPRSRDVSVARAPYEELLTAAFMNHSVTVPRLFHKYYKGEWDEPGLGGESTDLFANGQGIDGYPHVAWSDYRNRFVMIMNNLQSIAYGESVDGLHWPPLQIIFGTTPQIPVYPYANIVGSGNDPSILGDTFYSYYTAWPLGVSWQPATLNQLTITTAAGLKGVVPSSTVAGGAAFTLTLNGDGFVETSSVTWNASPRATTYVSSTQLTAQIPASDIAGAGEVQVEVFNPAPCGGNSIARQFTIQPPK